jgi:hypothetical protein
MQPPSGFSVLRQVRRFFIALLITILSATLLLRLDAAIFEYRVLAAFRQMEKLKLGQTSRTELANSVTGMRSAPCAPVPNSSECLNKNLSNLSGYLLYVRLQKLYGLYWDNKTIYEAGHLLGIRICDFSATFEIRDQKVQGLNYVLILDNGSNQYPGGIMVHAGSTDGYSYAPLGNSEDESPEYSVSMYHEWPELNLSISFTPSASAALTRHAFEPSLNCLWGIDGCRTLKQIFPEAWRDKENIERAVGARLHSSNPCPDRILPHRVRDASSILLVEVQHVGPEMGSDTYRTTFPLVDYKLLRVLKGKSNRPLKSLHYSSLVYDPADPRQQMPNPAIQLLHPGARVLMFSNEPWQVDQACEIVAATDSAIQLIRTIQSRLPSALALPR